LRPSRRTPPSSVPPPLPSTYTIAVPEPGRLPRGRARPSPTTPPARVAVAHREPHRRRPTPRARCRHRPLPTSKSAADRFFPARCGLVYI
jgi:hypothetical protein